MGKKPLQGSYSKCKVVWKTVNKAGYKEVKEQKCETVYVKKAYEDTKTECTAGYEKKSKTNGSALIIPSKKTLITAKTRNGNQPTRDARASMLTNVKMFPSPDTRMSLNKNAEPSTSKSPLKSPERLP